MTDLRDGWEVASSIPGAFTEPAELTEVAWTPARVPGTAAAAVGPDGRDFDAEDWWFRTVFPAPVREAAEPVVLEFDGIATVSQVFLNQVLVLESSSMWTEHRIDVTTHLQDNNELVIVCRALAPLLSRRRRPASRWRTRVVNQPNLRWYRTMMFGRSPGFAPGPAAVGPWRPVRVRAAGPVQSLSLRARLRGEDGVLQARVRLRESGSEGEIVVGDRHQPLRSAADGILEAEIVLPRVDRWWPHTHGQPVLHEVKLEVDGVQLAARRVGFRSLSWPQDIPEDGLDLRVNGVPVFARGAVWTPADLISLAPSAAELRRLLERVRDAGMNMLRVVGTGGYEPPAFFDLCDELGIMVWQDLMFANLDYPIEDPDFRAEAEREARQVLDAVAGRPCLAVICGNSEVEQQAAMLGLDPALGRGALWDETLPGIMTEAGVDCAYVRSTPCGGDLPFHPNRGITHYFGVSGYFRPTEDARRADVRFAAECLAMANVPDEVTVPVHHPVWKGGVQRDGGTGWDLGAGWDFDDVRDHYLSSLFAVDPVQLRRSDHDRYLELSRAVSGEVMAEVTGEWRREESSCRGALVLWLKDMLPGAGLGVLDHTGAPKVAYHHLRRALAPVAVWTTDEGVAGIAIHAVNDRPEPLPVCLRVALYQNLETCVAAAEETLELPSHGSLARTVEGMLGRFVDAAYAYRFGPPGHDAVVVSLESLGEPPSLLSHSVRFPAGRPVARESAERLGIATRTLPADDGRVWLGLRSRRLAYGLRLHTPGFVADDNAFSLEPGRERLIRLRSEGAATFSGGSLTALNLEGSVKIQSGHE